MPDAEPRILSPEDATQWQYPGDPRMSPAADRVTFTLTDASKPDEHTRSSVWMLDAQSGQARRFTHGPREDGSPRWSPDGSRIAFLSDREEAGKAQLYLIPGGGGEAERLTNWKGGVSAPDWSPDGRSIAVIATDPKTEEEEQREKDRHDEFVREKNLKYGRLCIVPAEGGELRRISREGQTHVAAFDWTPDGRLLALHVPSPLADDEGYGPSNLVLYSLNEGDEPQTVLHLDTGLEEPLVSPDGATVAYRASAGRVTTTDQVWIVPITGGEPRLLTKGYEGTVDRIVWSPDSREIRFVAYEDLWGALRAVTVDSAEIRTLLPESEEKQGSYAGYLTQDRAGKRFAVVRSASDRPPNVWVGTFGESISECTHLNERLAAYPFSRAEPLSWDSTEGYRISGLLYRPVGFEEGKLYPLVVHIHGGPAWLWSDRFMADWHDWAQLLAQRGYAVLLANPRGSTGRGPAFVDAEVNDLGGGELRDMLSGLDHVLSMGFIDPERLGVGGWSHGGYMTAWTVTQTDRFKCAVMGAGLGNLASDQGQNDIPRCNDDYWDVSAFEDATPYLQRSAVTFMKNAKTPTLILHGEKDERVRVPQAWEMHRGLQWAGVETDLVTYPREQHPIRERAHQIDLLERVLSWYGRFLRPNGN